MSDEKTEPKKEYMSMRIPAKVVELCKDYARLMELQNPGKRVTSSDAFELIYKSTIDIEKIKAASNNLERIRQNSIKASKEVLKGIEL